jgi:hypothetical protein
MFSEQSPKGKTFRPRIVRISRRVAAAREILRKSLCTTLTVVSICAGVSRELNAQAPSPAAPTADQQSQQKACEAAVVSPPPPPPPKPPENIADGTKAALACEWIDPSGVQQVLNAFRFLTRGPQTPDLSLLVLKELEKGDPYPIDQGLYAAALGDPDANGPRVQGLPDFLDTLAKANTLKKKKPDDEDKLFDSTKGIVDKLFYSSGSGKLALVQISESFGLKNNYLGLYQLLAAAWGQNHDKTDLEKLRAAFEMNTDKLAKQVAAKITAAKN